ncbi:hypothetical protein OE88DRAFT_1789140 [Heliocybe sulcata]|uniref:Uncharacterized protein n=1 Tax=Heliocybe sulcata TaxID=5364 RepID=A0A5C3NBD5_9AGAM|nr:hypothetical protein OE88DRAFT_1789140 [Heliocybe sulcata]
MPNSGMLTDMIKVYGRNFISLLDVWTAAKPSPVKVHNIDDHSFARSLRKGCNPSESSTRSWAIYFRTASLLALTAAEPLQMMPAVAKHDRWRAIVAYDIKCPDIEGRCKHRERPRAPTDAEDAISNMTICRRQIQTLMGREVGLQDRKDDGKAAIGSTKIPPDASSGKGMGDARLMSTIKSLHRAHSLLQFYSCIGTSEYDASNLGASHYGDMSVLPALVHTNASSYNASTRATIRTMSCEFLPNFCLHGDETRTRDETAADLERTTTTEANHQSLGGKWKRGLGSQRVWDSSRGIGIALGDRDRRANRTPLLMKWQSERYGGAVSTTVVQPAEALEDLSPNFRLRLVLQKL